MSRRRWTLCREPGPMLECLRGKRFQGAISERKIRLFGMACCRRIKSLLAAECGQHALEVGERLAEGVVSHEERAAACRAVAALLQSLPTDTPASVQAAYEAVWFVAGASSWNGKDASEWALVARDRESDELTHQADLLRCIFDNLFRPVHVDQQWLTSTVVELARGVYAERAFDRLPVLADALQDAGCEDVGVLTHCRGAGPHDRGCWVVDLVLAK